MCCHVTARSEIGKGTEISVVLPFVVANASQLVNPKEDQPIAHIRPEFAPCRVLIADDKKSNLQAQQALLKEMGFTNVVTCTNGQQALQSADECWPDLVLLDILMPVMGGVECARKLRDAPRGKTLAILGTTSSGVGMIEVESTFEELLLKPIDPEQLQGAIERSSRIRFSGSTSKPGSRILVVDDQPFLRRIIQIELGKGGYLVSLCASGEDALKRLETEQFDLILIDRQMPTMSGVETAGRIYESISDPPPLVLMSADVPIELARKLPLGVAAAMEKPFNLAQFDHIFGQVGAKRREHQ